MLSLGRSLRAELFPRFFTVFLLTIRVSVGIPLSAPLLFYPGYRPISTIASSVPRSTLPDVKGPNDIFFCSEGVNSLDKSSLARDEGRSRVENVRASIFFFIRFFYSASRSFVSDSFLYKTDRGKRRFLDASSYLYNRVCPSVRRSVTLSSN